MQLYKKKPTNVDRQSKIQKIKDRMRQHRDSVEAEEKRYSEKKEAMNDGLSESPSGL